MNKFGKNFTNFNKNITIPEIFIQGEKFMKWDEESGIGTPVTLKIDKYGFYLYWSDANNDIDCIDIMAIRDVRTGRYAKTPKDVKLKQLVTFGSQDDSLEDKSVSICCGSDFVNVTFVTFCCAQKHVAESLTELLLSVCFNLAQLNAGAFTFLQKAYVRLSLDADKNSNIPIKNVIKMFAQNKEDKKRVEKALDISGLPCGKSEIVSLDKFQFEDFFNFYCNLTQRTEINRIFEKLTSGNKRQLLSASQFMEFLNQTQRDPRLNEVLYPYVSVAQSKELITQFEPNKYNAQRAQLSLDGFVRYLMCDDNNIVAKNALELSDTMDFPLAHYFINSSHNTYLTGHQITGKSSVEIYRQCLLSGCRCLELDLWNGQKDEPVIVHGYTFVPDISAKEVLEAIAECAFKTSDFPVILSFENHCNTRQQVKIATYCRDIFGDMLLDRTLDSHKLESDCALPSPNLLKNKIIIKNKKKNFHRGHRDGDGNDHEHYHRHHHHHHHHGHKHHKQKQSLQQTQSQQQQQPLKKSLDTANSQSIDESAAAKNTETSSNRQGSKESSESDSEVSISDEDAETADNYTTETSPNQSMSQQAQSQLPLAANETGGSASGVTGATSAAPASQNLKFAEAKEAEVGAEISALVNYIQPVHFVSFEVSEKRNRSYEMSSFDEKQATTLLKEHPIDFVNYNKNQLSRVYPSATRFDSSNFMPQIFWNAGCQLVALNFQTLDFPMQLNLGVFEYNYRSGYLPKPEFMRRKDWRLDPFVETTIDKVIAGTVSVTILSGQFLSDKRIGTYVEVEMYGLPADTIRKKFRTKLVPNNAINPIYDDEPFVFKKVIVPHLATIRLAVYEESGKMIGHRILPVSGMCAGYRHVHLRTELGLPLPLATLFLQVFVKDYVPDTFLNIAEALTNPIKHQNALDKRSKQLSVLTDELSSSLSNDNHSMDFTQKSSSVDSNTTEAESTKSFETAKSCDFLERESANFGHVAGVSGGASASASCSATASLVLNQKNSPTHVPKTSGIMQASGTGSATTAALLSDANDGFQLQSYNFADNVHVDDVEKVFETKVIKEKQSDLEKKLESMKRRHEKEKLKLIAQKSGEISVKDKRYKFNVGNRLVKRLSSKHIFFGSTEQQATDVAPVTAEPMSVGDNCETTAAAATTSGSNANATVCSYSEKLLNLTRDHLSQEKEIRMKFNDAIFEQAEKILLHLHNSQLKDLKIKLEKEEVLLLEQVQKARKQKIKNLSQTHRDKDELERVKRVVGNTAVEYGVLERSRLKRYYERKREEIVRQQEIVLDALKERRNSAKKSLETEFAKRLAELDTVDAVTSQTKVPNE